MDGFFEEDYNYLDDIDNDQRLDDDLLEEASKGQREHGKFLDFRDSKRREAANMRDDKRKYYDDLDQEMINKYYDNDDFDRKQVRKGKDYAEHVETDAVNKMRTLKILKWIFLFIYIVEFYLFYVWVISPILPLIVNIFTNGVMPSMDFSGVSITNPFAIQIAGMKLEGLGALIVNEIIRVFIFSILFAATKFAHKIIKSIILD